MSMTVGDLKRLLSVFEDDARIVVCEDAICISQKNVLTTEKELTPTAIEGQQRKITTTIVYRENGGKSNEL